jgi:hypothetical protein
MIDVFLIDFINTFFPSWSQVPVAVPSCSRLRLRLGLFRWLLTALCPRPSEREKNFNLLDVGSWPIAYQAESPFPGAGHLRDQNVNRSDHL